MEYLDIYFQSQILILRYMAEQMEAWGNKGIFMHTSGRVPAAYADQPAKHIIARYSIYIIYIQVEFSNIR